MREVRNQGFLATVRSSPRKRRHAAWLAGGIVVLGVLAAALLLLPNTAGKPAPTPSRPAPEGTGVTVFWIVASVLFVSFLLAIAWGIFRFFWRLARGDTDEGAGSDGYTWRNPRKDLEDAMRSSSE